MGNFIGSQVPVVIAPGYKGYRCEDGRCCVERMSDGALFDPEDFSTKVKIFETQVKKRFLHRARNLMNKKYYGFIGLMVATSYIESIQKYREGETRQGHSRALFKRSVARMFDVEDDQDDILYECLRCSLFHEGRTEKRVIIKKDRKCPAIHFENGMIYIGYRNMIDNIIDDFNKYLRDLRASDVEDEIRKNFENVFVLVDAEE